MEFPQFDLIFMQVRAGIESVPTWNWSLQVVGLVTAYLGAELNSRMRISGFYVWTISNITLGALHAISGLWLLLLLDVLFLRINLRGIRAWSKEKPEQVPSWLPKWLLPPKLNSNSGENP